MLVYQNHLNSQPAIFEIFAKLHLQTTPFLAGVGGMAEATYYCYRFAHPAEAEQRLEVGRSVA